jgi:hypothetical protein
MSYLDKINSLVSYYINKATTRVYDSHIQGFVNNQIAAATSTATPGTIAATPATTATTATTTTTTTTTTDASGAVIQNKPPPTLVEQVISEIYKYVFLSLFVLAALYAGHLAANDAIGRPYYYRILYFIWGSSFLGILPFFYSPSSILWMVTAAYYIIQAMRGKPTTSYALIPVRPSNVELPYGLSGLVQSIYTYRETPATIAAAELYKTQLKNAS